MTYAYGMKSNPTVGKGLGGLPRRSVITTEQSGFVGWSLPYSGVSLSVTSEDVDPRGLAFSSDGFKMFVVGNDNDSVYQYSLTTAWDLSTASYDSVSLSVASEDTTPGAPSFSPDGFKMFVGGIGGGVIFQYSLTTAWDLSTASYDSVSLSVASEDTSPTGLSFSSDGLKMFVLSSGAKDSVFQYSLTTAWDLSTASYDSVSLSVASEGTAPRGLVFSSDGTKMYRCDGGTDSIYQYNTMRNP